jgi:hypothetical protein
LLLFAAARAAAEPPLSAAPSPAAPPLVKKATFNEAASRGGRQRVAFSKLPARVGDKVEQTLALEMRMSTTLRHGNQVGERNHTTARNAQRRVVTTTHVEAGRAVAVRVQYFEATRQVTAADAAQSSPPTPAADESEKVAQPIAGKAYLCRRLPGADGKLEITDETGRVPPTQECEIVAQHMEMVGRANPLAEFLAGQSIAVGQTIELPQEVAGKIFNLGEQFGEVKRFALTLEKLEPGERSSRAGFAAHVEAASNNAAQMRLELEGPLVVDADTCRAAKVSLSGPIAISETRGSYSTSYQVIGTGHLKINIASAYHDARR